jgi:ketosteroid isomerase-like protein
MTTRIYKVLFRRWFDALGKAWTNQDPKAAADICTNDVVYYETPFGDPLRSKTEVEQVWKDVPRSQKDIDFNYEVLTINGDLGIAHWRASFTRIPSGIKVTLDGIFTVKLNKNGLCKEFRQWWVVEPQSS